MPNFYRVMLGKKHRYAAECLDGGFIGADFGVDQDLSGRLPDEWREFNREFIPIYLAAHPDKEKIGAGLACGALWTVSRGILRGDVVLCPDGTGNYRVADVTGDYYYEPSGNLPHRRKVRWTGQCIERTAMSDDLRHSCGSIGTVSNISAYRDEIEKLLQSGGTAPVLVTTDPTVEDASLFAMEKHLEDFLVQNWAQTELGREYDIYQEDGDDVGQQYQTDTGPLDILAVSKDKRRLLVVELKKGRASDAVVGQTLRYMGYVKEELAEEGQEVRGVIIALEDDIRIRRALAPLNHIEFYRYRIDFKLVKA